MMLRNHPRPPPIDIIAAKSALFSASPAPTTVEPSPCLTPCSPGTGLIQILPPQMHMEPLYDVQNILYYDNIQNPNSPLSPPESDSSNTNSSQSNRHSFPPRSLPSSPALMISPVSPAFSDLTHMTFSEVELEWMDENTIAFVPARATWTSSKHSPNCSAMANEFSASSDVDSPNLILCRWIEQNKCSHTLPSIISTPPSPTHWTARSSLPLSSTAQSELNLSAPLAPKLSPFWAPPPSPTSTLPRSPISPLELPSPQYKPTFPRRGATFSRRREISTFDLPLQTKSSGVGGSSAISWTKRLQDSDSAC